MRSARRRRHDYSDRIADLALAAAKDDESLALLLATGKFEEAVRHLEAGVLARVVSTGEWKTWRDSFPSVESRVVDEVITNPFLEDDDKRGILDHFREDPEEAERTSRPYMERSRGMWIELLRQILLLMMPGAERPQ